VDWNSYLCNKNKMINAISFPQARFFAFSGDIHGEFETIVYKLNNCTDTVLIVCGDIGMGFHREEYYHLTFKKLNMKLSRNNNHLVMFRGNHDDPEYFDGKFKKYRHIHIIPDYTIVSAAEVNVLCVGGAVSIDRLYRLNMELRGGRKTYWGERELPYYDEKQLDEINRQYPNKIRIVATHTCPSFAYPTTKQNIQGWLQADRDLNELVDTERNVMDKIFARLQPAQSHLTDWYYGHFHEHKFEKHFGVNFRLCDCGEVNEVRD